MTKDNPFQDLWEALKGKGEPVQRRGPRTLYRVELSSSQVRTLGELAKKYPQVESVVERTEEVVVYF